jgi:hypothetical protein
MIAYHNYRTPPGSQAPMWFVLVALVIICGIGISVVAGIFAGQISALGALFMVVGLPFLAYILTRKIMIFGITFHVADFFTMYPSGELAGAPDIRQRLADCEARILRLKEGRP